MTKGKVFFRHLFIFIIMFIILNIILMCLFIEEGSTQVINAYKKELKNEVTLSTCNQSGITLKEANELNHSQYVNDYNYEQIVEASSTTLKPVSTRFSFPRVHLSQEEDSAFLLAGYSSMTLIQDFNRKEYKLIEGRLLNAEDKNTSHAVISDSLAKKNKLHLGNKIQFNIGKENISLTIVGIYKNKVGMMSHLKPYNTVFISLSKAQALNDSLDTISSVTYYFKSPKKANQFIQESEKKPLNWDNLQLKSNDAQYDACVSIFENIHDRFGKTCMITIIVGITVILFLYYLCFIKKIKNHDRKLLLTAFITLLIALLFSYRTSPALSKYVVNTYLTTNNMNMIQNGTKQIKTVYTPSIINKSAGFTAIVYLGTVIVNIIYKKEN